MKLIVGAGKRQKTGWTHHDIQPYEGISICCDFWELPKHVEASSCTEIEITHVLEHFPMRDTQRALKLLYGLLCDEGKIYIEVPNFEWHALEIISNPKNRQIVEYAYGGQLDPFDYHYNGFTPDILREDLEQAGFTVEGLEPNSSIECHARKNV